MCFSKPSVQPQAGAGDRSEGAVPRTPIDGARRGACRIASALPDAARAHLNERWQSHGKYHEAHGKEIQSANMCAE
jgi:hypothetical protein